MSFFPNLPANTGLPGPTIPLPNGRPVPGHAGGHGYGWDPRVNPRVDPQAATLAAPIPQPATLAAPIPQAVGNGQRVGPALHGPVPGFVRGPQSAWPPPPGWAGPPAVPYPPSGVPRRNSRRTWGLLGAGAAVLVVAVSAGLIIAAGSASDRADPAALGDAPATASSSTPTSAPPAIVPVNALPGLLLDPATVNVIEGATGIVLQPDPNPNYPYTGGQTNHPECEGIAHPAVKTALQGSGWVALQGQYLREPGDDWRHAVTQAVVSFPNTEAAAGFAAKQAEDWAKCTGKPLTVTTATAGSATWSVGTVTSRDGVLSVVLTEEGAEGWACQRAMIARNNVVIDTRSCGFNTIDQAAAIAKEIADRVSAQ